MAESTNFSWDFLKIHKAAFALFIVGILAAFAWAVYVFWWFTANAQSTGLVPALLGFWTMGSLVNFILYSILWELLLVGIPVAVAAGAAWMWWKKLPVQERTRYHLRSGKRSAGSGGVGFLFFIAFVLKVFIDGKWNVPMSAYELNYVIGSFITILVWGAVIFGIPIALGVAWWASKQIKKNP